MTTQKLIDNVLEQIKNDINCGDLTAIEELLWNIDEEYLINFLPENMEITYK